MSILFAKLDSLEIKKLINNIAPNKYTQEYTLDEDTSLEADEDDNIERQDEVDKSKKEEKVNETSSFTLEAGPSTTQNKGQANNKINQSMDRESFSVNESDPTRSKYTYDQFIMDTHQAIMNSNVNIPLSKKRNKVITRLNQEKYKS